MYQNIAIVAGCLLVYSAFAERIERSWLSGPIVCTILGLMAGPFGLGLLRLNLTSDGLRGMAEATLAMVLLADAANADTSFLRSHLRIPRRLLLVGLPLTVVLGAMLAWLTFPSLALLEVALLAAVLAPTDAALGAAVVANAAVPPLLRESLNVESGLNDGICVPLVLILLGYAIGTQVHHDGAHVVLTIAEEIGIGLAVGLVLTTAARMLVAFAYRHGWFGAAWRDMPVLALAISCFAGAQAIGGSGFIACFVGGLALSAVPAETRHEMLRGTEMVGKFLGFATWVVFGCAIVPWILTRITGAGWIYAVLSLTVIRMLPVYLCLRGTGLSAASALFLGWFGPRGLASLVFAIIILDERLPGNDLLMATIGATILLSVFAHGISATPLARRIGSRSDVPAPRTTG
ncbi:MAG: cation:proton antiporter [Acetobacteraceae bacterium]